MSSRRLRSMRFSVTVLVMIVTCWFAVAAATAPKVSTTPAFVDLRNQQTPLRNQGGRTTCITFAAIAALEAAYNRAGYGPLDLSEQFVNHMGKTFWLHQNWPEIVARGEDGWESQVGAFGGGNGTAYAAQLASGFRVPRDTLMPYRTSEYSSTEWAPLANPWNSSFWIKQRTRSDFNLNPTFLPPAALRAAKYYAARGVQWINAKSAAEIEAVLASGREVVWDFNVANTGPGIWRPCSPNQAGCPNGAHAMLLVGYDRRDPDRAKHYFIAKNSWGPTSTPGANGFTYISYDYLQYGFAANALTGVNPPAPWSELAFVGRWSLSFDGHKGTLDLYHLPKQSEWVWSQAGITGIPDRRLGSFYDPANLAYRVNGSVDGNRIRFYIDGRNRNARWDQLGGRQFNYAMVNSRWGHVMAGIHRDEDGRTYGGYAKQGGLLPSGTAISRPVAPSSYLGANWSASFNRTEGIFRFDRIDNSFLTDLERSRYTGVVGRFTIGTRVHDVRMRVTTADPNEIRLQIPTLLGEAVQGAGIYGKLMNFEGGFIAGTAAWASGESTGFVMIRQ